MNTETFIHPDGRVAISFSNDEATDEQWKYIIKYANLRLKYIKIKKEKERQVSASRSCETAKGQQPEGNPVL